ncbi:MAG: VOC family protein [Deltaproteobacteria bacterium]|nr:VOC family protein [Deltaproteobacteria bacterium]MBI3390385.1 VOC family protein [Deltaproteobacteria bacterium]
MIKLNHLSLAVRDYRATRNWYVNTLGLKPEFELADRRVAAVQDDADFTLILVEAKQDVATAVSTFACQVDDVEAWHQRLAQRGVPFVYPPQRNDWGYGAELLDPDGYRIRLWDEVTMREKSQG